jgi:N-acetylglucosamine kinase-like BadF-type ATPase
MSNSIIIADSGATKCQWTILNGKKKQSFTTQGISPYFMDATAIQQLIQKSFEKKVTFDQISNVYFYGTGLANVNNATIIKKALKSNFKKATIEVQTDLMAAARATCQHQKGIACILGTGSNTGFYNGKKIAINSPGLGYVLGDEGSGAYLGKKVLQYFLYNTFDEELMHAFNVKYKLDRFAILDQVYKQPFPNRFLASFCTFLSEHRGHYMIENIIEDGLNDFFFVHIIKLNESWKHPIHFVGSVAYHFRDAIKSLAHSYELEIGTIIAAPMKGLVEFHQS